MQERSKLSRAVEPYVSRLKRSEEPISDASHRLIGTRIADHEPEQGCELVIAEWELPRVGDLEVDILDAVRETNGLLDHLGREVDPDDGPRCGGGCP